MRLERVWGDGVVDGGMGVVVEVKNGRKLE